MEKRRVGRSELRVAPLCFGGNVFGWTADEKTSFALLDRFVEAGFDFIDTADVYSRWAPGNQGGESETIIGRWLKARGNRARVVIATKVGMEMAPDRKGLAPAYIKRSVEDSLKRLQTDYIDLYQSHRDDPETPLEATLAAYADLIKEGKVRAIGASNYEAPRLAEALKVAREKNLPRYESLQPEYNLCDRAKYESGLEKVCRDNEVGVITYYSLARGFLSGKYRSAADQGKSPRGGAIAQSYMNPRGFRILDAVEQVAKGLGATPVQVALAWLIARPGITAPIASATSLAQLDELIGAVRLSLDASAIETLNAASRP